MLAVKQELTADWWSKEGKKESDYWLNVFSERGYRKNIHMENFFEAFETRAKVFDKSTICRLFGNTYLKWKMEISSDDELFVSLNEEE